MSAVGWVKLDPNVGGSLSPSQSLADAANGLRRYAWRSFVCPDPLGPFGF